MRAAEMMRALAFAAPDAEVFVGANVRPTFDLEIITDPIDGPAFVLLHDDTIEAK